MYDDDDDDDDENSFRAGPFGNKLMEISATIELLKDPYSTLDKISVGRKDGILEKRKTGKMSELWDDCGEWKNASTPTTSFVHRNDRLVTVVKKKK